MTPRLKETFKKDIQPALKEQFGFKNIYNLEGGYRGWKDSSN